MQLHLLFDSAPLAWQWRTCFARPQLRKLFGQIFRTSVISPLPPRKISDSRGLSWKPQPLSDCKSIIQRRRRTCQRIWRKMCKTLAKHALSRFYEGLWRLSRALRDKIKRRRLRDAARCRLFPFLKRAANPTFRIFVKTAVFFVIFLLNLFKSNVFVLDDEIVVVCKVTIVDLALVVVYVVGKILLKLGLMLGFIDFNRSDSPVFYYKSRYMTVSVIFLYFIDVTPFPKVKLWLNLGNCFISASQQYQ